MSLGNAYLFLTAAVQGTAVSWCHGAGEALPRLSEHLFVGCS